MEPTDKEGSDYGREAEIHRDVGTVLSGHLPGDSRAGAETKGHEISRREIRFDQSPKTEIAE